MRVCVLTGAMPWGPQRGTSVQVGASSFPGGAPVLSPGCLSLRGGGVLVLRGDVWEHGRLLRVRFQPCCRPGGPAPHRPGSSGMWARNPSPDAPTLPILAPITVHLPPSGPAVGAPSAHFVCLAPHPTPPRGFFPLWIVKLFCLPKTGKQSKPAERPLRVFVSSAAGQLVKTISEEFPPLTGQRN